MKKYIKYMFAVFIVAGCNAPNLAPITQPPVTVQYSAHLGPVDRMDVIEMRSLVRRDGVRAEISSAQCRLTGTGFFATIRPPAYVAVPLFYGRSDPIVVQCMAGGNLQVPPVSTIIEPVNLSAPKNEGITIGTGTSGTHINALISLRNRSQDRFDYPRAVSMVFDLP